MYEKLIEDICVLVRECGEILRNAEKDKVNVAAKEGHGNLVTYYDKMVQDKLQEGLYKIMPEAVFFGEEEEEHSDISKGYAFIVDPIDGTTNFVMGANYSAISIGVVKDLERVAGVVYNPFTDEMFTAEKGKGAFLNGKQIHVSELDLKDSIAIFGTAPYYSEFGHTIFELAKAYFDAALDVRRYGTASLDLCSVACGRAAIYFEQKLSPWDFAAGSVILEEAGGVITQFDGSPIVVDQKCGIVGANKASSRLEILAKM